MPIMELMATVNATDPEVEVRRRVVQFLTSRGYKSSSDPAEFKRGSLFGSLTGFSPKKWAVTVRLKTVEPGVYFYRFEIDTTGQKVTRGERAFWDQEKRALEGTIDGRSSHELDVSDREVASETKRLVTEIALYSFAGALLVGGATVALHLVGVEIFPGIAGVGAGIGAAVGCQRALSSA